MAPALATGGPGILGGGGEYDPYGIGGKPVPTPVVMAVQGLAFTLWIEVCLASDIVISADGVRFRQLEIGRGIIRSAARPSARPGSWAGATRCASC